MRQQKQIISQNSNFIDEPHLEQTEMSQFSPVEYADLDEESPVIWQKKNKFEKMPDPLNIQELFMKNSNSKPKAWRRSTL